MLDLVLDQLCGVNIFNSLTQDLNVFIRVLIKGLLTARVSVIYAGRKRVDQVVCTVGQTSCPGREMYTTVVRAT
jgi:hypothetical protein